MTATVKKEFVCNRCGDHWGHDPRLIAPCPTCQRLAGSPCLRPSGHSGNFVAPHAARRKASFGLAPCSCLKNWESAQGRQAAQPSMSEQGRLAL